MSQKQYLIILELFHNYKEAFDTLSEEIKTLFYYHLLITYKKERK